MKVSIVYYWYHHGLAWVDDDEKLMAAYKGINKALAAKDYDTFLKYQNQFPEELPNQVALFIDDKCAGNMELNEVLFKCITYFECECG